MTAIKRSALVSYSARQMFELVGSIEEYPRFLPWCKTCTVESRTKDEVQATLEIAWHGIHKSFTTKNLQHPFDRIDISLVKGPFRHLEGFWTFVDFGESACKVILDLEFELTGRFIDIAFSPVFNHIANSLVDAFCKRAVEIYGES